VCVLEAMKTSKKFGKRIRALREVAGLTQEELGESSEATKQSVCDWEAGRSMPMSDKLPAIAKALGVEVGELFAAPRRVVAA
jgi:transcriptional regulator with XRE-family HTH domain